MRTLAAIDAVANILVRRRAARAAAAFCDEACTMKVVFLADVDSNRVGEVKEVKDGYARNYLLPRGLALLATKEAVERARAAARREERRQAERDAAAQAILARIGEEPFVITAHVGETGRLYGSVTSADIAAAIAARIGEEFDRHMIELPEPIRQTGRYTVRLRLSRNVRGEITVDVQPEGGQPVPATSTPAESAPAADEEAAEETAG